MKKTAVTFGWAFFLTGLLFLAVGIYVLWQESQIVLPEPHGFLEYVLAIFTWLIRILGYAFFFGTGSVSAIYGLWLLLIDPYEWSRHQRISEDAEALRLLGKG